MTPSERIDYIHPAAIAGEFQAKFDLGRHVLHLILLLPMVQSTQDVVPGVNQLCGYGKDVLGCQAGWRLVAKPLIEGTRFEQFRNNATKQFVIIISWPMACVAILLHM